VADVRIDLREGFGLASIMARKGVTARCIGVALDVDVVISPAIRTKGGVSLIGTGEGTWLAYADRVSPFWVDELRQRLSGLASVADQSSGYVIQRLSGPGARLLLQRGMPVDLHPDVFGPGSAATTVISHIGAIVWQLDDQPTYDVATFRSFSDSFRHWLDQATAAL
jgi:sarcosine oxidase subunit gamma